ncbi:hypothetical protein, partial [Ralstonia solanacearum]
MNTTRDANRLRRRASLSGLALARSLLLAGCGVLGLAGCGGDNNSSLSGNVKPSFVGAVTVTRHDGAN